MIFFFQNDHISTSMLVAQYMNKKFVFTHNMKKQKWIFQLYKSIPLAMDIYIYKN